MQKSPDGTSLPQDSTLGSWQPRPIFSGEKKAESTKEEKDWHVEERSYGSFYRSISLPFEPEDGAVDAHFDKGVLHLTIKKPAKVIKTSKTIDIKTGAPPTSGSAPSKALNLSP